MQAKLRLRVRGGVCVGSAAIHVLRYLAGMAFLFGVAQG